MTYVESPKAMSHEDAEAYLADLREQRIQGKVTELQRRLLRDDLIEHLPAPEPLIRGVLYRDSLVEVYGKPGCGKSFVALDWACHVATGKDWQSHQTKAGRVLYVVGEGAGGMGKRRKAWRTAWGRNPEQLTFLVNAVPLLDPDWVSALGTVLHDARYDLVVIDTVSRSIAGHNENAPETMSKLVEHADWLRQQAGGACVLLVHHSTKDGVTNRGHSALEGACDLRWRTTKDGSQVTLTNEKTKDDAEHPEIRLQLRQVDLGLDGDGKPLTSAVVESHGGLEWADDLATSETRLLTVARESFGTTGATRTELKEASGQTKSTFYRACNALVERGLLTNAGTDKRPHYFVTEVRAVSQSHAVPTSPMGRVSSPSQSQVPIGDLGGTHGWDRTQEEPARGRGAYQHCAPNDTDPPLNIHPSPRKNPTPPIGN